MATRICVLVAVALFACAACGPGRYYYSRRAVGPDGTNNYVIIECRLRVDCLTLAGEACPRGYAIVNDDGRATHSTIMVGCQRRR
jgi:hypothetical protein